MPNLSTYTATFPSDVLLDSGILYLGVATFGTLRGGLQFDPGTTWRNVDFDGKRSPIKQLDRKTMMMPKLSGTMIELGTADVAIVEPGATTAAGGWSGATSYLPKPGGAMLATGDYLTNVRAIWQRGSGTYFQVLFPSALVTKYTMAGQDNDEVAIALEIEARLDMGVSGMTTDVAPFRLEYLASV